LYLTAVLAGLRSARSAYSPPSGAITIGPSGSGAQYTDIKTALANTSSNTYFIYAGSWTTQVAISRANVTIYGQTHVATTYLNNTVTITNNVPASVAGSNDLSGTVRVLATGVKLYNLNILNTYGKPVDQSQAIALSVEAGTFGCYGCQLRGFQDTLLADKGTQFYGSSLIEGAVDFIFGRQASIWITKSTINAISTGYLTASGRQTNDAFYYVIDRSTIQGVSGITTNLGRPWGAFARVIYQNSVLGPTVPPAGWVIWSATDPRTSNVTFAEFNNTGPGSPTGARASFSTQLSTPISIQTVLGSTSWIDPAYL